MFRTSAFLVSHDTYGHDTYALELCRKLTCAHTHFIMQIKPRKFMCTHTTFQQLPREEQLTVDLHRFAHSCINWETASSWNHLLLYNSNPWEHGMSSLGACRLQDDPRHLLLQQPTRLFCIPYHSLPVLSWQSGATSH